MDISGNYTLNAPREQVWDALFDPDTLKRAVPGCESLQKTGDNEYTARVTVEAAGIKGVYDGTLKVLDPQKPESFRLIVDGAGARGILHGDGTLHLEAQDVGATAIHYAGQAQLGGTIASIGMGVASHEATRLINDCFARLARMIGGAATVTTGGAATVSAAPAAPMATPAATPVASVAPAPAAPAMAPAAASDALATPAAPHLESSLPRTAPIAPPHMTPATLAAPADADKMPATPASPAASATSAAPTAAPAGQQRPGWLQWLRRLLRME